MNGIERIRTIKSNQFNRKMFRSEIADKFKITDEVRKNPNKLPEYWDLDYYIDVLEMNSITNYDREELSKQYDAMVIKMYKEDMVDEMRKFPTKDDPNYYADHILKWQYYSISFNNSEIFANDTESNYILPYNKFIPE